eukprot:SAG22_NODE_5845_length_944_cov_1.416568_1_plen_177_part_00
MQALFLAAMFVVTTASEGLADSGAAAVDEAGAETASTDNSKAAGSDSVWSEQEKLSIEAALAELKARSVRRGHPSATHSVPSSSLTDFFRCCVACCQRRRAIRVLLGAESGHNTCATAPTASCTLARLPAPPMTASIFSSRGRAEENQAETMKLLTRVITESSKKQDQVTVYCRCH